MGPGSWPATRSRIALASLPLACSTERGLSLLDFFRGMFSLLGTTRCFRCTISARRSFLLSSLRHRQLALWSTSPNRECCLAAKQPFNRGDKQLVHVMTSRCLGTVEAGLDDDNLVCPGIRDESFGHFLEVCE